MVGPLTCPICRKTLTTLEEQSAKWAPFCSIRCRDIDLYRWGTGKYAIVETLPPERLAAELLRASGEEFDVTQE